MKYLFGPVKSRRLGASLGIDLVPFKTCTLNCVYCECGSTTDLTSIVKEFVPSSDVIEELALFLKGMPKLDYITFAGSGEPTLHSGIGDIIKYLKNNFPDYNVCVLTNGTLFNSDAVRESVLEADLIIPSLDAVSDDAFNKICRPAKGIALNNIISGLIQLREQFKGKIYLEIFIVPGINDNDSETEKLMEACLRIKPDRIQLNALDRPGTEEWVAKADRNSLLRIKEMLKPFSVDIAGEFTAHENFTDYSYDDISGAVISLLSRRPSTSDGLSESLGIKKPLLFKILSSLIALNKIKEIKTPQGLFYGVNKDLKQYQQ